MTTLTTTSSGLTPVPLSALTVPAPPPSKADWNDEGVVVLPQFLDEGLMDAYANAWLRANADRPGGFLGDCAYMQHPVILDLVDPLADVLAELIGEPAGMNLNLTGWRSTERDWHADQYLNPAHVGDAYAAVWVALGDIDPDSGPFQYVPGSHRWPQVTRETIGRHVDLADPQWPKHSEAILTPLFEAEIARRDVAPVTYLPERGDVLVWHGRLLHRGSKPRVPGMERRALIAHFSGIETRHDFPVKPVQHRRGWYWPIVQEWAQE